MDRGTQHITRHPCWITLAPERDRGGYARCLPSCSHLLVFFLALVPQSPAGLVRSLPRGLSRMQSSMQSAMAASMSVDPNPTILVVDEHPSTRQIITKWMTSSKYTEISCASGAQAMDILSPPSHTASHHVDLIICDVNVLVFDGQLLLDWVINNVPSISQIPVIVLSSNLPSQGLERLIRRGAWDVLHKPLNRAVFLNALATVFNTRKQKAFIERLRMKGDEYKERFYHRSKFGRNLSAAGGNSGGPRPSLTYMPSVTQLSAPPSPMLGGGSGRSSPAIGLPVSSGGGGGGSMQPIQVLLIERDPRIAAQLREWIEDTSVVVRHVTSVHDALPILREGQRAAAMAVNPANPSGGGGGGGGSGSPIIQRLTSTLGDRPPLFTGPHTNSLSASGGGGGAASQSGFFNSSSSGDLAALGGPATVLPSSTSSTPATPIRALDNIISRSFQQANNGASFRSSSPQHASQYTQAGIAPLPPLASIHFGVELILIGHDALIPPECLQADLASLGVDENAYQEGDGGDYADEDGGGERVLERKPSAAFSPIGGLAASQMLVDLSLQPVWGKPRRLPVVVVCEEDGPSPVAMAILKHVALTILTAPLSHGLVVKKVSILLALIEQNRQSLLLARRAHIYKGLLTSLVGDDNGGLETDFLGPGLIRRMSSIAAPSPSAIKRAASHQFGSAAGGGGGVAATNPVGTPSPPRSHANSRHGSPRPHHGSGGVPTLPESGSLLTRARTNIFVSGPEATPSVNSVIGATPEASPTSGQSLSAPHFQPLSLDRESSAPAALNVRPIIHSSRARGGSGELLHPPLSPSDGHPSGSPAGFFGTTNYSTSPIPSPPKVKRLALRIRTDSNGE